MKDLGVSKGSGPRQLKPRCVLFAALYVVNETNLAAFVRLVSAEERDKGSYREDSHAIISSLHFTLKFRPRPKVRQQTSLKMRDNCVGSQA